MRVTFKVLREANLSSHNECQERFVVHSCHRNLSYVRFASFTKHLLDTVLIRTGAIPRDYVTLCTTFSPRSLLNRRATHTTASLGVSKCACTPERECLWFCSERRVFSTLLSYPNRFMMGVHPRYTYITQHGVQPGGGRDGSFKVLRNLRSVIART